MKKIIVLLALVGIFGVLRAQDIQVPTYDSEFDMTPTSFTVGADGGKFSFKLTCDQYGGLLRAEADTSSAETYASAPPLANVSGFEYIGFEDTAGQGGSRREEERETHHPSLYEVCVRLGHEKRAYDRRFVYSGGQSQRAASL